MICIFILIIKNVVIINFNGRNFVYNYYFKSEPKFRRLKTEIKLKNYYNSKKDIKK